MDFLEFFVGDVEKRDFKNSYCRLGFCSTVLLLLLECLVSFYSSVSVIRLTLMCGLLLRFLGLLVLHIRYHMLGRVGWNNFGKVMGLMAFSKLFCSYSFCPSICGGTCW
jgi:hypothetical protein